MLVKYILTTISTERPSPILLPLSLSFKISKVNALSMNIAETIVQRLLCSNSLRKILLTEWIQTRPLLLIGLFVVRS